MAQVHGMLAMSKRFLARPEETEAHAMQALKLSPRDPFVRGWYFQIGASALQLGQHDKAVTWLRRSIEADRNVAHAHFFLASALAHLGRLDEARRAAAAGIAIDPAFPCQPHAQGRAVEEGTSSWRSGSLSSKACARPDCLTEA
jgi:tetratricopeptide (TPR) repeat protein